MSDIAYYKVRKFTDADMAKISISDIAFYTKKKVTDVDMVLIH